MISVLLLGHHSNSWRMPSSCWRTTTRGRRALTSPINRYQCLCGHVIVVCGHVITVCGHVIIVCSHVIVVCGHVIVVCGRVIVVCGHVIVVCGHVIVVCSHVIVVCWSRKTWPGNLLTWSCNISCDFCSFAMGWGFSVCLISLLAWSWYFWHSFHGICHVIPHLPYLSCDWPYNFPTWSCTTFLLSNLYTCGHMIHDITYQF